MPIIGLPLQDCIRLNDNVWRNNSDVFPDGVPHRDNHDCQAMKPCTVERNLKRVTAVIKYLPIHIPLNTKRTVRGGEHYGDGIIEAG